MKFETSFWSVLAIFNILRMIKFENIKKVNKSSDPCKMFSGEDCKSSYHFKLEQIFQKIQIINSAS